jgi:hypothetical protein
LIPEPPWKVEDPCEVYPLPSPPLLRPGERASQSLVAVVAEVEATIRRAVRRLSFPRVVADQAAFFAV